MEIALDGKTDVAVKGKGFAYKPDRVEFPSGRKLSLSLPAVDSPGRHAVKVTLRDGGFAVSSEASFVVEEKIPFEPKMTVTRSGRDLWSIVISPASGEPGGTYSVSATLDKKAVPGFLMADGKAVGNSLQFASDKTLSFSMGPVPVGAHVLSLTLKGGGSSWPLTASISEDRLGISLTFQQKIYDCIYGYFALEDGKWTSSQRDECVIHEEMTMTVDYGWKGRYSMDVYMKAAGMDDPEAKVTKRREKQTYGNDNEYVRCVEVAFENSADLSPGKAVVSLPQGRPPVSGRTDRDNVVRVVLTPQWNGASTVEFTGSFRVPFDKVNGFWFSSHSATREAGVDTWSPIKNGGIGYQYEVNGVRLKEIKSDGVVPAFGIMDMPYYPQHPPQLTVEDPTVCEIRVENTYNLLNPRGLKEGSTIVTVRKDYAEAQLEITVVKTRSGDGYEVLWEPL